MRLVSTSFSSSFQSGAFKRRALLLATACALAILAACGGGDEVATPAEPPQLLVANTRGNNVVSLDRATGAFTREFIAAKSGGLSDPDDLTFGPDGNLYVSSGSNTTGQILRFNAATGAFIDVFAQGGGLMRPYGNVFGPDGHLYVASFRSDQILKYNGQTGAFIGVLAKGNGTAAGLLNGPNDLLFGADGKLYVTTQGSVADGKGEISYKFDSQVVRLDPVTGAAELFAASPRPTPKGGGYVSFLGLAMGPDGLLYTTDYAGGIRAYDLATKALRQTIDTGALFPGSSTATTVGNLSFGKNSVLYAPVFNANASGTAVNNGIAQCSLATATAAASCSLLVTDNKNLLRPIGIASLR